MKINNCLKLHCSTSDFTMNSLACDINGQIIDYFCGIKDINNYTIKCVGNPTERFTEDPLRIIRAFRQKLQLGQAFSIDDDTQESIDNNRHLLDTLPAERIHDELIKMLNYPTCFELLFSNFILDKYLPSAQLCYDLQGGKYHKEKVLEHLDFTFKETLKLTDDYRIHLGGFLHDIGKGTKQQIDEDNNMSFKGHEKDSMIIAEQFMSLLKFSNADIKYVTTMIKYHMMGDVDILKNNTIIKIYNDLEDAGISVEDMLIMTYCDNQGNMAKPRVKFNEFYKQNNWLRQVYKMKYQRMPFRICDLEIDGKDCLKAGLEGKQIGDMLEMIFESVVEGETPNERHKLLSILKR